MDIKLVLKLLEVQMGLNAKSIGISTVEKHIRQRMAECGASSVYNYLKTLDNKPSEMRKLIETVVIPETYFFRDRTPFVALKNYVRQFKSGSDPNSPLRILSVPCSTGEEPYSIAMLLFDMNMRKDQFQIDAVDISEQFIRSAKNGLYRSYSFRGKELDFRDRYFLSQGEEYLLKEQVLTAVDFQQGNLLAPSFASERGCYDIIFCRNLLIYFDEPAKKKAIAALSRLLCRNGLLFVGHAETTNLSTFEFSQIDYPMAFAFARTGDAIEINAQLNRSVQKPKPEEASDSEALQIEKAAVPARQHVVLANNSTAEEIMHPEGEDNNDVEEKIEEAFRLADKGAHAETVALCERLLKENVVSAELYYLLGKTVDVMGDRYLADEYLRKALYLDPGFYDVLIYLAELSEGLGDYKKADGYRTRAGRVKKRS